MKTKNFHYLLLGSLLVSFTSNSPFSVQDNLPSHTASLNIKSYFSTLRAPIFNTQNTRSISKSKTTIFNQSLTKYVKEIYNNKYYSDYISQNGTHVVEFLELSNELNLDIETVYTCLRLFYNKIKSCELIDDTVVTQILEPLPDLLAKYFTPQEDIESISLTSLNKNIEKVILNQFTQHLPKFQAEPDNFLSELSAEISQIAKKELDFFEKAIEQKEMTERLRNMVIRFFETALSKTIWNNTEYEGIWQSVLSIANGLHMLGVNGVLDHMDDLDDMLWSLTHRFSFFIDLTGSSMPLSFFEEIENDLDSRVIFLLESQEQDEGIKSSFL